jgi:hypothetical protein
MDQRPTRGKQMKRILAVCAILALNGCALIMANFDSTEYQYVVHVRTLAESKKCDADTINALYNEARELKNYSQYIPHNDAQNKLNSDLFTIVDELHNKQNPSPVYCEAKLNIVAKSAERIQQVTGTKPR